MGAEMNVQVEAFERADQARQEFVKDYPTGAATLHGRDCLLRTQLEAAAPLIVAAELERIAAGLHTSCRIDDLLGTAEAGARNGVRNELLARASELRGEV